MNDCQHGYYPLPNWYLLLAAHSLSLVFCFKTGNEPPTSRDTGRQSTLWSKPKKAFASDSWQTLVPVPPPTPPCPCWGFSFSKFSLSRVPPPAKLGKRVIRFLQTVCSIPAPFNRLLSNLASLKHPLAYLELMASETLFWKRGRHAAVSLMSFIYSPRYVCRVQQYQ